MNPVDSLVGSRIRDRRKALGMTQTGLAGRVGVTFQQLQKYENGTNKVAASRLHAFAHVLGVEPAYFFDNLPAPAAGDAAADLLAQLFESKEHRKLNAAFQRIKSVRVRRAIVAIIDAVKDIEQKDLDSGRTAAGALDRLH